MHYSTEIQRYLVDSEDPRKYPEDEECRPRLRSIDFDSAASISLESSRISVHGPQNNYVSEDLRPSVRNVDFDFPRNNLEDGKPRPSLSSVGLDIPGPTTLEQRKNKLTASTFGSAIGMWAGRRAQLWLEKLNFLEPFSGNSSTQWKNLKSDIALNQYLLITGNRIQFLDFIVYREGEDWLSASPNGVIINGSSASEGVLEIKCPFFKGNLMSSSPWVQVPVFYMPQVQGLMEILDREWLDLFCWTPNGSSLIRVPRDREYWYLMKTALVDFWWKHVIPAKEILSVELTEDSIKELKMLRPRPRHELFNSIACSSRHLARRCDLIRLQMNQMS